MPNRWFEGQRQELLRESQEAMGQTLALGTKERHALLRHAQAEHPRECCGLILGRANAEGGLLVTDVLEARNLADEPHRRYFIDPEVLIRGHRRARRGEEAVLGYYHSHPLGEARPSAVDFAEAWHGYSYLILGRDAEGFEIRAWRLAATGEGWLEDRVVSTEEPA